MTPETGLKVKVPTLTTTKAVLRPPDLSDKQIESLADKIWAHVDSSVYIIWLQGTFDLPRSCILACMSKVVGYDLGTSCRDERFIAAMVERFQAGL